MTVTWQEFAKKRQAYNTQFFAYPGATRTILVSSHIWWTEQMAFSLYKLGHNVLIHFPFYLLYTDETAWAQFDALWNQIIAAIRHHKVEFILGGNSTGIVPHPKTGELLHEVAGIPAVNYWWDQPRATPPFARRGFGPDDFLKLMRNGRTLNAVWDIDQLEELAAFHDVTNTFHLPLATLPEYWPQTFIPMEQRPLAACFLGNCHYTAEWVETDDDPLTVWTRKVVDGKAANSHKAMVDCIREAGPVPTNTRHIPADDPWCQFFRPWEFVDSAYMHRTRNVLVKTAADHLKGKLALVGKGWEKLGLRANAQHAGDNSGLIYAQSQASLNLFGGCVHGGMPLRPFDIGASGGLIVTHDQRELPDLFEVGRECLAFRNGPEMLAMLDQIFAAPAKFNEIARAGRQRVLAQHTWAHRMTTLLGKVSRRFS